MVLFSLTSGYAGVFCEGPSSKYFGFSGHTVSQNTELFFFGAECVSVHYVNNPHDCVPIKLYKNKQRATFGLGL